ncbi:unnamed protein product [Gongylonema pulchrum]|uniref:NR LBD domain-containing protein n=1 Tax=Gongylonema pulchrum TaxID=637853 RepID=A0A183EH51_9BILA|nr:unnamed protein product [Gongylonema pulchrum]
MERSNEDTPRLTNVKRQRIVQVAWTRLRDEALLTAGEQSFTTDSRFQISLKPSEADWVLIIR